MVRDEIKKAISEVIEEAQTEELLLKFEVPEITVERSGDEKYGDYASNIALKISKLAKKSPNDVAQILERRLKEKILFAKVQIAPNGFINFFLLKEFLQEQVHEILEEKDNYGGLDIGQGKKVQVEFISANPTGPLTLGNARGGFLGDTLANILQKAGYVVQREFLINDAGYQIEVLGHSILGDEKAQYNGGYIEELREKLKKFLDKPAGEIGFKAAQLIFETMIKPVIEQRMKIKFDNWFSEKAMRESGAIEKIIELLKEKKVVFENEGALWFKSTDFGDDKDRVLITSENSERGREATYISQDIAYHYDKFIKRKFDKAIDIWAADHHGYVSRLQAAKKALEMSGELTIIVMQLVKLFQDGKEVRMSKRSGIYVTIEELLDEIPLDVARFFFLMYSPDTHMDFNLDLAREQSEKNPVYYVQYAYARICSIFKKSDADIKKHINEADNLELLNHPAELILIKQLIRLPEIIEDIVKDYQVQRLPQYALDLVRAFHKFYEGCRVIDEKNQDLTKVRLVLVESTRIVLKNTLDLMGISAPEKM